MKTYGQKGSDVTGMKPAIFIQRLSRPFGLFEVAHKDIGTLNTDFALTTGSVVVHFGNVN